MKKFFAVSICLLSLCLIKAQQPGFAINHDGSSPHPNALLELDYSTTPMGFLAPRMEEASLPASPIEGLIVYITDGNFPGFYQYVDADWKPLKHNNFKGFLRTGGAWTTPVVGSDFVLTETDGASIVFTKSNTGTIELDYSAYGFTSTPVVTATSDYIIADQPPICNGIWGGGQVLNNNLNLFILAAQTDLANPIIRYETDLASVVTPLGLVNDNTFGADRGAGYDPVTPLDDPPGRYTYYESGFGIAPGIWAVNPNNASNWPDNDQFPHPGSTAWTTGGDPEVYNTTPMVAGDNYVIQVRGFFDDVSENTGIGGSPFNNYIGIFIDYNKDGDFDDVSEVIYQSDPGTWTASESITFPVPTSAINGKTRLRIVVQRSDDGSTSTQTTTNPDLNESCLANFNDIYLGHTTEFDVIISGGAPEFIYEGTFCNVSEPSPTGAIIRCYTQDGVLSDDFDVHFNIYDKF